MSNGTGKFLEELVATPIDDINWRVDSIFEYLTSDGQLISVPAGFLTDFASVPRFLPIIYSLCGDTEHKPAVIHDWLYRMTDTDRSRCDWIFRDAAQTDGSPAWRRWMMWAGVRAGGWLARKKIDGIVNGQPVAKP